MSTSPPIELLRRRDVGEMINLTFEFLRMTIGELGRSVLYICGPVILAATLLFGFILYFVIENSSLSILSWGWEVGLLFAGLVVLSVVAMSTVINAYVALYEEREGGAIDVRDVWDVTRDHFGGTLLVVVTGAVLTVLASFFFFLPGIYLVVTFSSIATVRMAERLSVTEAISRCTELIKGNWWETAGLLFVVGLIGTFLSYGSSVPSYLLTILAGTLGLSSSVTAAASVVAGIIGMAIRLLLTGLSILAAALNYYNLLERREGLGLLAKIEQIGALVDEDGSPSPGL